MSFIKRKSISFFMLLILIPCLSLTGEVKLPKAQQYPEGFSGSQHAFEIARFGLNQDVVQAVVEWATSPDRGSKIYTFNESDTIAFFESIHNEKINTNKPISNSYFLDCIAWCNAVSEMEGLEPVYYMVPENVVFRDSTQKSKISIAAYNQQDGYRIASKGEVNHAVKSGKVNEKFSNFLLARTLPDEKRKIKNPKVVVEKMPSVPVRMMASTLNPVLGLGSYLEGDVKSGLGYTFWQGLGLSAAYVGWYTTQRWQQTLKEQNLTGAKIDYMIPNIIVGTGLGIYGISALTGIISPYVKPVTKKYTFKLPNNEETEVSFGTETLILPDGQLGFGLCFAW